jgi:O-antigen/teichoic acid export membrane protein
MEAVRPAEESATAPKESPFRMRRLGKNGLIYGGGIFLNKAVAFLMLPIYTRFLTPADYGILQLIDMTIEVVSILAGSRMGAAVFRYYHKSDSVQERHQVLSTALILMVFQYALIAATTVLVAPRVSVLVFGSDVQTDLIRIASASLAFQSLVGVPLSYLQVRERSGLYVSINAVKLVVQLSLNILFVVHMGMAAKGVLLSGLIANMLIGCVLTVYLVRDVGLRFSRTAARQQVRFGLPFVGTQVASFVLTFGDRYFLQAVSGAAAVGIYALAYQFGFLLAQVGVEPFTKSWNPMRFEIARRADRDRIFAETFVYYNLLLVSMGVGLALFAPDVIRIMADESFHAAAHLIPPIVLIYLFYGWTKFADMGILVSERTEYLTLANWLAAILVVVGYALLIPRYLALGAVYATLIAFVFRFAAVYAFSQQLWWTRYDWAPVLRLAGLAMTVAVAGLLVPAANHWLSVGAHVVLFLVYVAGVVVLGVLPAVVRQNLWQVAQQPSSALALLRR